MLKAGPWESNFYYYFKCLMLTCIKIWGPNFYDGKSVIVTTTILMIFVLKY